MGISDRILTIGSCFADAIGMRLLSNRLPVLANPFGNLYNAHSIHNAIRYAVYNELPAAHTYLERDGISFNYDFHSELSDVNQHNLSGKLKEIIGAVHYHLAISQWMIITYGTAWVYERKESGAIVANCHKLPNNHFTKSLLSQQEITESFGKLHNELKQFNPEIKIILTVSPVRHIKDTLELNSVSKAVLRAACHSAAGSFTDVSYFPSYEIMIDDLRDYR
ncbi:MAG TPA: GSCFA domain-containing protein, partial [Chryseolinea sp.]